MIAADVNFDEPIFPEFPSGWQSASDVVEGLILVAALELQTRRGISPRDPFAEGVHARLPPQFRYDPFRGLIAQSGRGEFYGRLPLLSLVWRYVEELEVKYDHLRHSNLYTGYSAALAALEGITLGAYGARIFQTAFPRRWFDPQERMELAEDEIAFINARPIQGRPAGVLNPSGDLYLDSIWFVAFRLIELRSPEHYLEKYCQRRAVVDSILNGGAQRGLTGERYLWPGWPE